SYKIWHGNKEIDEEMGDELFGRSWRVAGVFFLAAPVFVGLDYLVVDQAGVPAGPVHVVFFLGFLAFAAWMMMLFFAMEDFFQGLALSLIFLYLPTALFFLAWLVLGWFPLFSFLLGLLAKPTA